MKKASIVIGVVVGAAISLTACGGGHDKQASLIDQAVASGVQDVLNDPMAAEDACSDISTHGWDEALKIFSVAYNSAVGLFDGSDHAPSPEEAFTILAEKGSCRGPATTVAPTTVPVTTTVAPTTTVDPNTIRDPYGMHGTPCATAGAFGANYALVCVGGKWEWRNGDPNLLLDPGYDPETVAQDQECALHGGPDCHDPNEPGQPTTPDGRLDCAAMGLVSDDGGRTCHS